MGSGTGKLASMLTMPMRMLLLAIAGWLNEEQRERIASYSICRPIAK